MVVRGTVRSFARWIFVRESRRGWLEIWVGDGRLEGLDSVLGYK